MFHDWLASTGEFCELLSPMLPLLNLFLDVLPLLSLWSPTSLFRLGLEFLLQFKVLLRSKVVIISLLETFPLMMRFLRSRVKRFAFVVPWLLDSPSSFPKITLVIRLPSLENLVIKTQFFLLYFIPCIHQGRLLLLKLLFLPFQQRFRRPLFLSEFCKLLDLPLIQQSIDVLIPASFTCDSRVSLFVHGFFKILLKPKFN